MVQSAAGGGRSLPNEIDCRRLVAIIFGTDRSCIRVNRLSHPLRLNWRLLKPMRPDKRSDIMLCVTFALAVVSGSVKKMCRGLWFLTI